MPHPILSLGGRASRGFSLVEVLMCIAMLAMITLPFVLMTTQTGQLARAGYMQSTRTILMNSLKSELANGDPNFIANYTDGSMNTGVIDSGQTMPYRVAVDNTTVGATTSMKRTTHFYIYTDATDATNAPRYTSTYVQAPKVIRQRMTSSGLIDNLNRYWWGDSNLYSSGSKIPGKLAAYTGNVTASDALNATGNDDALFQSYKYANPLNFSADVENGAYTVKLYFAEMFAGINATTNRRLFNIYLEGVKVNTEGPYSPMESTGGLYRADIRMYDVNVTDGVLNVSLQTDGGSNDANAFLTAIEIRKRSQQ
jgi:prepilin-type N-terminal cleavage/methylation domain-containing protein